MIAEESAPVFLFVDVDGYCAGGLDQRVVVSPQADGYRARELGWAYYTAQDHATGSIYFRDERVPELRGSSLAGDASFERVHQMHGLPVRPGPRAYSGEAVLCSSRLLEAFRIVHDAAALATGRPVVIVHKGGNEGLWASQALAGVTTLDLGAYNCPKVDAIGRERPAEHVGRHCRFHALGKRRARGVVHCPRLEVALLAGWVARCRAVGGRGAQGGSGVQGEAEAKAPR
jgi:hypothetical protein